MNSTIVKIIDMMFRGMPENEETAAMREELLTNSQARYDDLIASGVRADDALGQVLDSLRGMEDVLDEYRREQTSRNPFEGFERIADKAESTAKHAVSSAVEGLRSAMDSLKGVFHTESRTTTAYGYTDAGHMSGTGSFQRIWQPAGVFEDDDMLTATFRIDQVNRINVQLIGEDIEVEPSPDGLIHVEISKEDEHLYLVEVADGCLTLRRDLSAGTETIVEESIPEELNGLSGIFSGIGKALKGVFQMAHTSGDTVRLQLPDQLEQITLQTAAGDIDLSGLNQKALAVSTVSGDIDMQACRISGMARLSSTSGDVDVDGCTFADSVALNSTSGDINFGGSARQLTANNVSGDTDLEGDIRQIRVNAVSGDLDLCLQGAFDMLQMNTTSGDITVTLPVDVVPAVRSNTTSGDVSIGCITSEASVSRMQLNTVSGDISVENF
ncbi:MAG: DUF4097 domain-containing protein [Clostridiales bacterium]|nr:DUF4097 domain-containing protein [Clostridiales bacterium]